MIKTSKIYIAGHTGLAGSSIYRLLKKQGYNNLITRTHKQLDLLNQNKVFQFFGKERPDYIFLAAAKVGGILANSKYPASFVYENLQVQNNVIHSAYLAKVKKLLFLGSSCIYPRDCAQPIKEEYLLTSALEPTNEPYAIAKIAGIKMCQSYNKQYGTNFISLMPTNLYGQGDNFDLENSHVLAALIRKIYEAKKKNIKKLTLWGTGNPRREFLYVDDLAEASVFLMQNYNDSKIVNIGTGKDISIYELAQKIKNIIGYRGKIEFDKINPDGTPQKLLDVSFANKLGWQHKIELDEGLKMAIENYTKTIQKLKCKNQNVI